MANKEIKQTIRLAGEKEYSAALRDAQRNLRTLKSELKAETAELGANATAQQKNETRARSLKAQIAEQEKVVETLKKALAEAKKDYSDNENVVQKWEQKLNEARATLADMQSGLSDAENAMRGASDATAEGVTATKSFADALGEISSVGESVSGAIESIFTGLIGTVRDVVVDLWDVIGETAAKANNWTDIAGYWNTDPANVEKWARAVEASGNSFEDFEAIVSKLVLGGKGKQIAEMLGVSDVNYKDQWDYAVAVMDRIADLKQSGNLPDNLWETIFGEKKATKAMDILNDWADIQEGLTTFSADEGGYSLGKDALETMNDLYVQINTIEQKWIALKDQMAGGLGTITADLLVNVSGSLDALNEFMNAETEEEREAALKKLRENIEELFAKLAVAIRTGIETINEVGKELQQSDDPIVSAIGNMLVQVTDALEWLVNNADAVKIALESLFGVWFMAKLATIASKLAAIVAQIETIKAFKGWNGFMEAAGGGAGEKIGEFAAESAGAGAGAASTAGFWSTLGSAAAPVIGGLAGGLAGSAIFIPWLNALDKKHYHEQWDEYNANEDENEARKARVSASDDDELTRLQAQLDEMLWAVSGDEDLDPGADMAYAIKEAFRENANDYLALAPDSDFWEWAEQFADTSDGLDADEIEQIINGIYLADAWQEFGIDAANAMADRIDQLMMGTDQAKNQVGLTSDDVGAFKGLPGLMRQALLNRINGLEVSMDGQKVGHIVAQYVSEYIAADATQ